MTAINFPQAYQGGAAVTPNDSTALPGGTCKGLYIGAAGSGNLSVIGEDGNTVAFVGVTAATVLPIACTHVRSTGTDVTDIVALY